MSGDSSAQLLSGLGLLNKYVGVRASQFAREGHPLWIVNGATKGETTAALSCARWAYEQAGEHLSTARTLNLASDEHTLQTLEQALVAYQSVSVNMFGSLEQSLDRVLRTIGSSPAFVMVDPLADEGLRIDTLARMSSRRTAKTELLLTLSASSLQDLTATVTPERLDRIIGSSLWRRLSRHGDERSNLTRISVLYRACLQRRGYSYARKIQLREDESEQASRQLVFATRSRSAVAMMSDLVCRYQREDREPQPRPGELAERVCRFGAQLGSASVNQIIRGLSLDLFGQFTSEDYRETIRELVQRGSILVPDHERLTDEQVLTFSASSQMALFDSDASRSATG